MDIELLKARRSASEQAFSDTQDKRNRLIEEANALLVEMNRYEGEHRALDSLVVASEKIKAEEDSVANAIDPAAVVEIKPEKAKKGE